MGNHPATVLVIDDEPGIHKSLTLLLQTDFSIHTALSGEEGLKKVDVVAPDLILLDLVMPQMSGVGSGCSTPTGTMSSRSVWPTGAPH